MSVFDTYLLYNQSMDNKLQKILNSDNCFFIHYASNGFYNGSSPAPKISCIMIWNDKTKEKYKFDIQDHLNGNSLEQAEKETLAHFKTLFVKRPDVCFIHWNMMSNGFGFKAIQARAKEFGIDLPIIDNNNLFDLAAYVEYLVEKKLSIKQALWFNSLLDNHFLDGKTEAEYFNKRKFNEITESVHTKTMGLCYLVEEIKDGTLKTEAPYRNNDGLTKEERRQQALKLAETREKMINDIYEHNKKVQAHNERVMRQMEDIEPEYMEDEGIFYYNSEHPLISLFASWFANWK